VANKTVVSSNSDDNIITNPIVQRQKEDVAKMRASLLSCNDESGIPVSRALQDITIMRIYHQLTRIIRFTEMMDKIEDRLYEAIDYQIGAYFTECLCDSLDKIMDIAGTVDDPESERSRIMQRVRANGIKGVYQNRLTDNTKLLDELCGIAKTNDGNSVFMPGAPLVRCYMAKKGKFYIAAEFVERAKKEHPKRNEIEFYK
jgi:hypothetical protein